MREIKFRAWDKRDKVMRYSDDVLEIVVGESRVYQLDSEPYGNDMTQQLIPLQYIGTKDKKGIEIYEGDIVLDNFLDNTWEVYYDSESAWFWLRNGNSEEGVMGYWNCSDDPAYPSWDRYEVIGNIYENPELLKK